MRDAFIQKGHEAVSCDLIPTERPGPHVIGDARELLDKGWDLLIAHPPCTDLAVSGAKHFHKKKESQEKAIEFFYSFLKAPIPRICVENPIGVISTRLCKPTQIIQPWMFGDSFQKSTCLWLRWLPPLIPTNVVSKGEFHITPTGKKIPTWYSNNKKIRSHTFPGLARAMAEQWGGFTYGKG